MTTNDTLIQAVPAFNEADFHARIEACEAHFKGRITLKSLKVAQHLSEETLAFTATVYIDGKRAATARNDGRGGETMVSPLPGSPSSREVAQSVATLATFVAECRAYTDETHLFGVLDLLVGAALTHAENVKACRTKVCFRLPDMERGVWLQVKWPELAKAFRTRGQRVIADARFQQTAIEQGWFKGHDPKTVTILNSTLEA